MTPTSKRKPITIVDIAKGPPPSKPQQIEDSQTQKGRHTVLDLRPYYVCKRIRDRSDEEGD